MDDDKAIRSAKLTLGAMMEKRRAETAKSRAQGQIAPSKYLPDVPRQMHANGGKATFTQGNHPDVPDVVYHGTNGDFTAFRPDGIHWFTSDKMDAADYRPKRIVEAHLSLKNPADLDAPKVKSVLKKGGFDPENLYDLTQSGNAVKSLLMGMGYDGIMVSRPDVDKGVMHYAVFHPHQIKSATDNNGNFDPNNPDITKATGGGVPRQVHANGGYVPQAYLPIPKLAVAKPLRYGSQPSGLEALANMAGAASSLGDSAATIMGKEGEQPPAPPQDSHAGRAEAGGGMSTEAVAAYNALLEAYGQPLTVTSTYRDPAENQRVGGAKNSQHTHGNAYDIDTSGMSYEDRLALADMAWNAGFRGVGFYDNSMHFDVGDPRSWGPTYSRDSIPDWAQDWTQQRYGYANGGRAQGKERFLAGNHPLVPEVLYHGTARDIRSFHPDAKRSYDVDPLNPDETDTGWFGKGHYLTAIPQMADHYAEEGAKRHGGEGANVIPVHVSMKNPFVVDMKAYDSGATTLDQALTRAGVPMHPRGWRKPSEQTAVLMQMGHDGVIATREGKPKEYVAFKPEQIKSAISATKFDPNNPDMTYANGGAAPTMSPLLIEEEMKRDAMRKPDAAAQTGQALDAISNAGRVGSIAGKLTGIPLGGVMGRKLAESIAMSEYGYADGGRVDEDDEGIDAYHGSPHDFDEFDIGKIGTGEGAQAYGHGLYFAGNEGVAKGYRAALSDTLAHPEDTPHLEKRVGQMALTFGGNTADGALKWLDKFKNGATHTSPAMTPELVAAVSKKFSSGEFRPGGHMYKVKLNVQPHELLDWDAPLSEQHPNIQRIAREADISKAVGPTRGVLQAWREGRDVGVEATGKDLHKALSGYGEHNKDAADYLQSQGLKGIKYRDAGSRDLSDGDPTHNYVMFHHDPVKVVDKYALGGYVPQRTQKAYKLFRTKGDGKLYPLFVHADKPVEMGKWLEAEEGPQGKAQGKVKSKLGDLAYRPGWHAGDLPIATHIGGKSSPDLKKPDYRPDNHVWAEVEMAADKDWQAEADSRGKGVKAHITDQVPLKGFYRYKTNPNMTGNWLIGGHMKVNRVLSDDEVKAINDQAGVADLPRLDRVQKADGGSIVERSPMFEGMHEELYDEDGKPTELWHGTPHQFDAFDDSKIGSERDAGFYGRGHYLTPDQSAATDYADDEEGRAGHVMGPLHAALKNPYIWDVSDENRAHRTLRDLQSMGIMRHVNKLEPWSNLASHEIDTFMKHMQDRGHDGVLMKTQKERGRAGISEVVVFKPSAIKHRDAEVGDPEDPRIMRNLGGRLYSKASKIIRRLKDEPMQVEDIIKYALENGAKRSEIDYSDPPRGGMARPSQVAQHIADMQPQVGVQRREGGNFRFKNSDEYLRELDRLNNRGMHDEAERLYDEFERFEGYGGANQPRYARYQLPGGENYREHILTLDNHQGQTYTAPIHWSGTQNPLAHIRMSDRIIGNRKILHIEELQSDWNNDARKRGFSTGTEQQDYDNFVSQMRQKAIDKVNVRTGQDYYDPMTGETAPTMSPMVAQAQIEKYQRMDPYTLAMKMGMQEEHRQLAQAAKGGNGVPRAPYINPDRDDVIELAMKHILTEAAKGGYDGIAFTPDAAQSQRWKGTNFKNMYDRKFPGMAQRLIRQHDLRGGSDDDPQIIDGWAAPHVELTEKARQGILQNGFSSFRRGGYVTHVRRAR